MHEKRLAEIQKVLLYVLASNLLVCGVKVILGLTTGATAIAADGFHSLGDSLSNVVGLIGISFARRKPDHKHSFGYERFEAVATLLIVPLISITCYKVFETGIRRLMSPEAVEIDSSMLVLMAISMVVNIATIVYEGGAGRKLKSQLLIADSNETRGDVWISGGVIVTTLIVSRTGWFWLDGVVTIAIGLMIVHLIVKIVKPTAQQLADAQVVDPKLIEGIALSVAGVKFCHAIRSRGHDGSFWLECHLGVDAGMSVEKAHDVVCHNLKVALREKFPGLKSVIIHIEPDNEAGRLRTNSVFHDRDTYGHE